MFSFYVTRLFKKIRYTSYVHGKEPFLYNFSYIRNRLFRFPYVYNVITRNSESIVFVSEFIKSWFLANVEVENVDCYVVSNTVDLAIFNTNTLQLPNTVDEIGTEQNSEIAMVTACRLVKEKGFDRKLDVCTKLTRLGIKYIWYIAGDGSYRTEFERKVSERNLTENIVFLGRVHRKDLKNLYLKCDIFWLLSSYEEAYPLVYHEAQACGLPVIGLNRGGVKEVIQNGVDGFVVDSSEEAVQVIASGAITSLLMSDWDSSKHSIERLYEKLNIILANDKVLQKVL
jgi:glycosyltransferase involved in cell wall biosynthesis